MLSSMNNGNLIRIILPCNVYEAVLKELNKLDNYLKNGIREFLCVSHIDIQDKNKKIFFEKVLEEKDIKSDLIYGNILIKLIPDVIARDFSDLPQEEWEVMLPYCMDGFYTWSRFNHISPSEIILYDIKGYTDC